MTIEEIQKDRGLRLPGAYLRLLAGIGGQGASRVAEGRRWTFLAEGPLAETVEMAGVGAAPAHRQLALHLACYREVAYGDTVAAPEGEIPIDRVAEGFVVAEDGGDLLYLDPGDGFSVWIFHHDGCDVEKAAPSLADWLARASST